jgi:plastocyanin
LYKIVVVSTLSILLSILTIQNVLIDSRANGSVNEFDLRNDNNYEHIIKNNFLTYTNQTLALMLKYPDSWRISAIGNDTVALISPIEFSGILINKLNLQDLDQFVYKRINLQKESLPGFQLIESNDIPFKNNNSSKVLMYIFGNNSGFFRAAEVMFNGNTNSTYHLSFVSNSSLFDTIAPAANKILESLTILGLETVRDSDNIVDSISDSSENNVIDQDPLISNISNTVNETNSIKETEPTLSVLSGAGTPGNPSYYPDPFYVTKGKTITVTNDAKVPTTVTSGSSPSDANVGQHFDTGIIMSSDSEKIDTSGLDPGYYPYHCTIHPFMKGLIVIEE